MPRQLTRRARTTQESDAPTTETPSTEETGDNAGSTGRAVRGAARTGRAGKSDSPGKSGVGAGWGVFSQHKAATGDYPEDLKLTDEAVLVKILDDEPFASYRQHWIERPGKKSWTCRFPDPCPLCDELGDKPKVFTMFNVIVFDGKNLVVKVLRGGTMIGSILKNYAADDKTSPLSREDLYWSMSQTGKGGKGGKVQYNIRPIKARDLSEDWSVDPLDEDEIAELAGDSYDASIVQTHTVKDLEEIVEEETE